MPEVVRVDEDLGIIVTESSGAVTEAEISESLLEIVRLHKEHGISRVLIDATRVTQGPDSQAMVRIGEFMAERVPALRFAAIVADEVMVTLSELEMNSRTRGMQVAVFDVLEAALAWLLEGPKGTLNDDGI